VPRLEKQWTGSASFVLQSSKSLFNLVLVRKLVVTGQIRRLEHD